MTASTVATSDATTHAIGTPGDGDGEDGDAALRPPMEADGPERGAGAGAATTAFGSGIGILICDGEVRSDLGLVFGVCCCRSEAEAQLLLLLGANEFWWVLFKHVWFEI
jgi:hypothetical protein